MRRLVRAPARSARGAEARLGANGLAPKEAPRARHSRVSDEYRAPRVNMIRRGHSRRFDAFYAHFRLRAALAASRSTPRDRQG